MIYLTAKLDLAALLFATLLLSLTACCNEEIIPIQSQKLFSSNARERNDAALELARCGEKAARAVPRLGQLIYDKNIGVQSAAAYALRKIDTPQARSILEAATNRKNQRQSSRQNS